MPVASKMGSYHVTSWQAQPPPGVRGYSGLPFPAEPYGALLATTIGW